MTQRHTRRQNIDLTLRAADSGASRLASQISAVPRAAVIGISDTRILGLFMPARPLHLGERKKLCVCTMHC